MKNKLQPFGWVTNKKLSAIFNILALLSFALVLFNKSDIGSFYDNLTSILIFLCFSTRFLLPNKDEDEYMNLLKSEAFGIAFLSVIVICFIFRVINIFNINIMILLYLQFIIYIVVFEFLSPKAPSKDED